MIVNKRNGNAAIVGNVCVNKFLEHLPSGPIFAAVKGVKRGQRKSFNEETVLLARRKRWITEWEKGFYVNTMRRRKLSDKQLSFRRSINEKILQKIVNAR